ncbi:unnamed protein product [Cyberlindnera jadinii]|uniref:Peptidase S8/S53 domain-containing protein n=1 Tax=Cyberlindnera jadinii (strain ATCC 18201 / CBS 1600 / BCRC 20928 / JCM 3617 / NBRC 0987 / NRRL Y-1542) TaxID=983966 RepID=A0A0H5C4B5_CYBJN|nr:unnamed protein product [Cyberlindnera jadinii]
MLPLTILTLGLAALQTSSVQALKPPTVGSNGHTKQQASFGTVPGRFIVEYDTSSLSKRDVLESVASSLSESGVDVSVNTDFDSSVFQGASITLTGNDTTVDDLKALAGVRNAWPASVITLDDEIKPNEPQSWNPHLLTGVQAIHDQGNKGSGVKIAIIDTGVDYTHPALGGGIGEGYPITHGYDFYSDINNPSNDPMDCNGHGTFVTSLIISSDEKVPGVAPGASVSFYKVFGCEDSTTDDVIIAAMIKAYEEKPDVMTLSLGSNQGL